MKTAAFLMVLMALLLPLGVWADDTTMALTLPAPEPTEFTVAQADGGATLPTLDPPSKWLLLLDAIAPDEVGFGWHHAIVDDVTTEIGWAGWDVGSYGDVRFQGILKAPLSLERFDVGFGATVGGKTALRIGVLTSDWFDGLGIVIGGSKRVSLQ